MPEPQEPSLWRPLWLDYSGLAARIGETIRHGTGWAVFCQVVAIDCARNTRPDAIEISLDALGQSIGISGAETRKTVLALRKLGLLACFLPETDEEAALLKVRTPLPTPVSHEQLPDLHPEIFTRGGHCRYALAAEDLDEPESKDAIQEVVDLYFNTVGLKMNTFVLDELRLLTARFGLAEIRRVFRRAQKAEVRSLGWIAGQLARARTRDAPTTQKGQDRDA